MSNNKCRSDIESFPIMTTRVPDGFDFKSIDIVVHPLVADHFELAAGDEVNPESALILRTATEWYMKGSFDGLQWTINVMEGKGND